MRRFPIVCLMVFAVGCTGIFGPKSPKQVFLYAKALYRDELSVAVSYSEACVAQPTIDCAEMVQKLDDLNQQAATYLLAGDLLLEGFVSMEIRAQCPDGDVVCIEEARSAKLLQIASLLQGVSASVAATRGGMTP